MNLKNLMSAEVVALVLAVLAAFSGFTAGRQQTTDRIEQMQKDIATNSRRIDGIDALQQRRSAALYCAIRTLDRLTEKAHVVPPCPFQEIN